MIPKGPKCQGCPALTWGPWMVPDEDKPEAEVIVVAQNPGKSEEKGLRLLGYAASGGERWESCHPGPLTGQSGWDLRRNYLPLAGLGDSSVECRNVIRCRWQASDNLPPLGQHTVRDAIRHCQRAYWKDPRRTQRVVALGAYSLWALTQEFGAEGAEEDDDARANRGIDGWRGWVVPYKPAHQAGHAEASVGEAGVFATYHPAYFYRAHWLKAVGRFDWHRIGRWLAGKWPEPFPQIEREAPSEWPHQIAFDTEYFPHTGALIRYSAAFRDAGGVPSVFVVEAQDIRLSRQEPHCIVQHNAEADWPYLASCFGRPYDPGDGGCWEDTMYAHSVLHGTWRHTLDFLGSLYARTNRWKHLEQSEPIVYAGMDALATWDCWEALERELARDPQSTEVYRGEMKPLLRHVMQRVSIRVATDRVTKAVEQLGGEQREIALRAQAAAGWPIKVTSADQVARWLGIKK